MAKNNGFIMRWNEQKEREKEEVHRVTALVTMQQAADAAVIALNACFHFGPERSKRFFDEFQRTFREIGRLCLEDAKSDTEIAYTKETVDRCLREILGKNFCRGKRGIDGEYPEM